MKIDNDEIWEDVKQGKYLGFSIEGFFSQKEEKLSLSEEDSEALELLNEILNKLKDE